MNLNSDAFLDGLLNFFTVSSLNGFEHLLPYAVELLISLAIIDIATTWTLYDGHEFILMVARAHLHFLLWNFHFLDKTTFAKQTAYSVL